MRARVRPEGINSEVGNFRDLHISRSRPHLNHGPLWKGSDAIEQSAITKKANC
jgi:hypothetical protein